MDLHRHLDDELSSLRDRVLLLGGEAEQALLPMEANEVTSQEPPASEQGLESWESQGLIPEPVEQT
jgi:hypothetical protein